MQAFGEMRLSLADEKPNPDWRGGPKVRWARDGEALLLRLNTVTSQTRIYKQTLDHFFRREFRDWRPRHGEFCVEITVEVRPGLPAIDLDNVAKAVLDGVKGAIFFDDAQVGRLVVERIQGECEQVTVLVRPR